MESCDDCGNSWNGAATHRYGCSYYFANGWLASPATGGGQLPKPPWQMYEQDSLFDVTPYDLNGYGGTKPLFSSEGRYA